MKATPSQLASYLSTFAELRAASDEYHAAMLRLIGGETVNVAALQARAIELTMLHTDWLQSALPLASKGAFAKLTMVRPGWQQSGDEAVPSTRGARGGSAPSNERDWEQRWPKNLTSLTRLIDTAKIPMLLTPVRSVCIDAKKLTTHPFKFDTRSDAHDSFGGAAKIKDKNVVVEASVDLPTVSTRDTNEHASLPRRT